MEMVARSELDDLGRQRALQNVFRQIVTAQNPTKDDTCLKKLLDVVRMWEEEGKREKMRKEEKRSVLQRSNKDHSMVGAKIPLESLVCTSVHTPQAVDESGCLELLRTVKCNSVGESVMVFAIELLGTLVEIPGALKQNFELMKDTLCHFQSLVSEVDPTLGTPFFNTLKIILNQEFEHNTDTSLLVDCKGLLMKCWNILETGKSIFYTNAVINFLKLFTLSKNDHRLELLGKFWQKIIIHVINVKGSGLFASQLANEQLTVSTLKLLFLCPVFVKTTDAEVVTELIQSLEALVCGTSAGVWNLALDVLLVLTKKYLSEIPECRETVLKLPLKIAREDFCKCQKICVAILEHGISDLEKDYIQLILCPLQVFHDGNASAGTDNSVRLAIDQMSSKGRCLKLLWSTLDSLSKLQNIPDAALEDVMSLFSNTVNRGVGSTRYSHITAHVFSCRKIQLKCCEIFIQRNNNEEDYRYKVGSQVFLLINTEKLDNTLYSKCMHILLESLPSLLRLGVSESRTEKQSDKNSYDGFLLSACMQKRLCDIEWEIRDTTLEFIQNVLTKYTNDELVISWVTESRFCSHIMSAVKDSNSYVRATALQCLASVLQGKLLQVMMKQAEVSLVEVVQRVLLTLTQDTEAFARRAAMDLLIKCWKLIESCGEETKNDVYTVLENSSSFDFDWEVKLKTVQFWDGIVQCTFDNPLFEEQPVLQIPSYAVQLVHNSKKKESDKHQRNIVNDLVHLQRIGCLGSLLKLLEDFDQSVCKEACGLLMKIKGSLQDLEMPHNCTEPCIKKQRVSYIENIEDIGISDKINTVWQSIITLDLEEKLKEVSITCDEYDRNPLSLLQDITAQIQTMEKTEENLVDCY